MKPSGKIIAPVIIIFVAVTILVFVLKGFLTAKGFDANVLLGANTLFFLMGILVFWLQKRALQNANPNVFVRSVISGMMIKMFACVIAVLAYVVLTGSDYNKRSVFLSLFIYLLYLAAEVAAIMQLNKKNV
jgi:hypothetical protein